MSEMTDTHLQNAIYYMERKIEDGDCSEMSEWRLEELRAEHRRRAAALQEAKVQSLLKRVSDLEAAAMRHSREEKLNPEMEAE